MNRLPDLLDDLAEADTVGQALRRFAEAEPRDPIATINLDAVMRRRRDLERELGALLGREQHDLIRYRIELSDGTAPPAAAVSRSVLLFQTLVTAAFDAIRTVPKRLYQPSNENVRLSSLSFASPPAGQTAIHFTIPNDRLLIVESDLDAAFAIVFELLTARAKTMFRNIAVRAGIASVAAAYAWAENAAQHGLTTTITWRKASDERRTISISHSDALLFRTAIEAIADEAVEAGRMRLRTALARRGRGYLQDRECRRRHHRRRARRRLSPRRQLDHAALVHRGAPPRDAGPLRHRRGDRALVAPRG